MTRFPTQAKSPGGIIYWLAPITWPSDCRSVHYPDQRELLEKTCTHGKCIHTADDCWVARIDDNKTMVRLSAAILVWSKKLYFLLQKCLGILFCEKMKNSLAPQWYKIPTRAIYWHVFKNLTHMLLVLHWALSNCLRPLWDSFHAFKIKITYTPYILMLTSRLEVMQKHACHSHQNTPSL